MLTNPPVPYDFCVGVPISHLLKCESASRCFQPGEGRSRGLLRDCITSPIIVCCSTEINIICNVVVLPGNRVSGGGAGWATCPRTCTTTPAASRPWPRVWTAAATRSSSWRPRCVRRTATARTEVLRLLYTVSYVQS